MKFTHTRTKNLVFIAVIIVGGIILSRFTEDRNEDRRGEISQTVVSNIDSQVAVVSDKRQATVFRSSTCGCCMGYIAELEKQGFTVDVKSLREQDMDPIKKQYGIPAEKQSCHTTIIGDYFIEGHVPMEAVEKLLTEKPKIDGIGLPGMPFGTPGMPGKKQAPYEIYEKVGDTFSEFMTL